jgi:excinuclease ABC subunit C
MPTYVSLLHRNRFPRAVLTRNPAAGEWSYGPFPTRADADRFLSQALDLFQVRRCEEELSPSPPHPGCMYGEMGMCLRPCQQAVSDEAYRTEVRAFWGTLQTRGQSLREQLEAEREAASASLRFEQAARAHKRLVKLADCFPRSFPLAAPGNELHGVAISKGAAEGETMLWLLWQGNLQAPLVIPTIETTAQQLRALLGQRLAQPRIHERETRQDLLAVLQRWARSSWCDGEWLLVDDWQNPPLRKIRNAMQRVVTGPASPELSTIPAEGDNGHASGNL